MNDYHLRLRSIALFFLLLFLVLIGRVFYLTYLNPNSKSQKILRHIQRGNIYDRRGIELALSKEAGNIGIEPNNIYGAELTADTLAPLLEISPNKLKNQIETRQNYFLIKREVNPEIVEKIRKFALRGVRIEKDYKRIYPQGSLASSLIGFTGYDDDKALSGIENLFHLEMVSTLDPERPKGNNIHLTIDSVIQYRLEKALSKAYSETKSKRAIGVIMDAQFGKILAMASFPNFDPNHFSDYPSETHTNWAIRHVYEPGSTMKIFIALMLLNEGAILPKERFHCPGFIEIGEKIIKCTDKHGSVDLEEILQYSCNVGIIKAAQKISDDTYFNYMEKFHFGKRIGFSIHEARGFVTPRNKWTKSTPYFLSIGQGISVTPIQLISAAAAVVNGGILFEPLAVQKITNSYGELVHEFQPRFSSLGINRGAAEKILEAMGKAVSMGTGKKAYLENYFIAGKTGTAQKAKAGIGYEEGLFTASFLGFFPAEKPKYVGLVLFDEPGGQSHTGGGIAAPVFREIVESIIPVVETSTRALSIKLAPSKTKQFKVPEGIVPNFKGLSLSESLQVLSQIGTTYSIEGSGFVFDQSPQPGVPLSENTKIKIRLQVNPP